MSHSRHPYSLFSVVGIELEYMIADADTLDIRPMADQLIYEATGQYTSDVEQGGIAWSNELALHVVELKTNGPSPTFEGLSGQFHQNVQDINARLAPHGARLLPTGAHPWMDPLTETRLWPHEYHEVYNLYNRIFSCQGHGWSNVQSMHINLPFSGDAEFGKLHAAIRVLLPLLPALAASTPVLDGRYTGRLDARMHAYQQNQKRIPSITGHLIPEAAFTEQAYEEQVLKPIQRDIAPYDTEGVLDRHFLNSRGAIARFDRGAIEIRVLDLQEAPAVDLAIAQAAVATLQALAGERWSSTMAQMLWNERDLLPIFNQCADQGHLAVIDNADYLGLFGFPGAVATAQEVWWHIRENIDGQLGPEAGSAFRRLLQHGTLAHRIVQAIDGDYRREHLRHVYRHLAAQLQANAFFNAQ
jgi:carboxylate-amine ligase